MGCRGETFGGADMRVRDCIDRGTNIDGYKLRLNKFNSLSPYASVKIKLLEQYLLWHSMMLRVGSQYVYSRNGRVWGRRNGKLISLDEFMYPFLKEV